jgi:serine/threonine-protein kinase
MLVHFPANPASYWIGSAHRSHRHPAMSSVCDELRERLSSAYEVGDALGTGATGVVVAAKRRADGRDVAIKTLLPAFAHHQGLAQRLEREAVAGRTIRHPGIVPVLNQGRLSAGRPYVVFARLRGESLLSLLGRGERLTAAQAALVAQRVTRVLGAVHGAGYVHRDVKPEHIVLTREEQRLRVHLIDFGVCQAPDSMGEPAKAERGLVFGTPGYLAPEQAAGQVADARTDLYGLGATLYELISGRAPFFGANPARVLQRVLSEDAPRLDPQAHDAPHALCALAQRLLARDPNARPGNARALARELAVLCGDEAAVEATLLARLRSGNGSSGSTPTKRLSVPALEQILAAQG